MSARAALLIGVALAGCASTGPIVVPLRESASSTPTPVAGGWTCRVVATVEDERTNKATLGAVDTRPLEADGVQQWVSDGVAGFARPAGDRSVPDLATRIGIERVFARTPTPTQIEAVVALRATFSAADGRVSERRYRGVATRLNWVSGGREFAAAFNDALTTAVAQMAEDVSRFCPAR